MEVKSAEEVNSAESNNWELISNGTVKSCKLSEDSPQDFWRVSELSYNSNIPPAIMDGIRQVVRQEVQKLDLAPKPMPSARHEGVMCDKCKAEPILGVRYYCFECRVNFCSKCEEEDEHLHLLYKIKTPKKPSLFARLKSICRNRRKKVISTDQVHSLEHCGKDFYEKAKALQKLGFVNKDQIIKALINSNSDLNTATKILQNT